MKSPARPGPARPVNAVDFHVFDNSEKIFPFVRFRGIALKSFIQSVSNFSLDVPF